MPKNYTASYFIASFFSIFFFYTAAFSQDYELKNLHVFKGSEDLVIVSQQMGKDAGGNIFGFSTFRESFVNGKDSFSSSASGNSDVIITRFTADGQISKNIHIDFTVLDKATDVAITKNDEIYISGSFKEAFPADSVVMLLKCDENGKVLWSLKAKDGSCMGQSVSLDEEGNIYLSGYIGKYLSVGNYNFYNDSNTNHGAFIIKLNPQGEILWAKTAIAQIEKIETTQYHFERMKPHLHAIRPDGNGNMFFIGHFSGHVNFGNFDAFTTKNFNVKQTGYNETFYVGKISKDGEVLWMTNDNAPGRSGADNIILDKENNLYLDIYDYARGTLQKYSPDGRLLYSIPKMRREAATFSRDGKIFIHNTGIFSFNKDTLLDFSGKFPQYPANHIMTDDSNYIYIKSFLWSKEDTAKVEGNKIHGPAVIYARYYFPVLKLSPKIEENDPPQKNDPVAQSDNSPEFILYPNPADQFTNIELSTENEENYKLQISDLQGRLLYFTHFTIPKGKTKYRVPLHNFRSGMYIIQLTAGEKHFIKKLFIQ